ncbi:MAG: helix-turn-helix domain-containing protein [Eubacterium sp.]|nr:helix-turn-helix domain-containing protein [Eubacterium sp.]
MTIREIRKLSGLSQNKFADYYEIPRRTLQNWESLSPTSHHSCPEYLLKLLERAVKEDFGKGNGEEK